MRRFSVSGVVSSKTSSVQCSSHLRDASCALARHGRAHDSHSTVLGVVARCRLRRSAQVV